MKRLRLVHLYPREMNIYGDWGNIITIRKRLEWRGYHVEYVPVHAGDSYTFSEADIVFGGGGQDKGQLDIGKDLLRREKNITQAVEDGAVFLLVCGLYQLFGNSFTTQSGEVIKGIGVFDMETIGSAERLIGNVVVQTSSSELVGFENHSGKTFLNAGQAALGRVVRGNGNNGEDGFEGAITRQAFGTYMHGALLPKSPVFADELLHKALMRRYGEGVELAPLEDEVAAAAARVAKNRPL